MKPSVQVPPFKHEACMHAGNAANQHSPCQTVYYRILQRHKIQYNADTIQFYSASLLALPSSRVLASPVVSSVIRYRSLIVLLSLQAYATIIRLLIKWEKVRVGEGGKSEGQVYSLSSQ